MGVMLRTITPASTAHVDIGTIHQLGDTWSLLFRDPDGMELEVCAPI